MAEHQERFRAGRSRRSPVAALLALSLRPAYEFSSSFFPDTLFPYFSWEPVCSADRVQRRVFPGSRVALRPQHVCLKQRGSGPQEDFEIGGLRKGNRDEIRCCCRRAVG